MVSAHLGKSLLILSLSILFFPFSQAVLAQTTGAIEGTVTDPSQAAIPGATVKVVHAPTGVETTTTTNSTGYFVFENMPAGNYDISINQPGFKVYSVQGLKLDVASRLRHDITLTIGAITESVTVQASAVQVDTSQGTVSAVITREQIATAVLNGRHYARLAMMMPGAVYHQWR